MPFIHVNWGGKYTYLPQILLDLSLLTEPVPHEGHRSFPYDVATVICSLLGAQFTLRPRIFSDSDTLMNICIHSFLT